MSFDTSQLTGLNGDAKQIIFALKSKNSRLEAELKTRTEERDRARRFAVSLEQELHASQHERCLATEGSFEYVSIMSKCEECAKGQAA